jgi:sec-independent protein translocase protein TatA
MPTLGPWELGIILLIVVVIFGAGKLPEIGGAVGKSIREFKQATTEEDKAKQDEAKVAKPDMAARANEVREDERQPVAKDETVR